MCRPADVHGVSGHARLLAPPTCDRRICTSPQSCHPPPRYVLILGNDKRHSHTAVQLLILLNISAPGTGLAGSVLEARLNRTDVPRFYCSKQHDWEVEWLSVKAASRPDCLLDELTVQYDSETKR